MKKNFFVSLSKEVYLFLVRLCSLGKRRKNDKIIFLVSFPSTSNYVLEALAEAYGDRLIICYTRNARQMVSVFEKQGFKSYLVDSFPILCLKIIPILKKSKLIICDNYFAFLGGMILDKQTNVVQIWHANGAIKKFGLQAQYAKNAAPADRRRYQKVYNKFTHFVVSSPTMATIFKDSYNIDPIFLKFGYPLTDYYYQLNDETITYQKNALLEDMNKKIALYLPTYRENADDNNPLDFDSISNQLNEDWALFIHPHPHDKKMIELANQYPEYFIKDDKDYDLKNLIAMADCLITDYSSVPFEYSLVNPRGKIIYFCYDFELYDEIVGIQEEFKKDIGSSIVKSSEELFSSIETMGNEDLSDFNQTWNTYVSGRAMDSFLEWIDKQYEI